MKTKMTALLGVLMIGLVLVGVGFAMWDKTIYIYGTVSTGEVDAEFSSVWCTDTGIDPGHDKDVGWCVCEIDWFDPQILWVDIYNGYPCYSVTVNFEIDNTGTIPVKIQSITLTNPNTAEVTVTVTGIYVGQQIDGGDFVWGDLEIHVEQSAAELSTYSFSLEIYLVQWNEFV